MTVHLVGLGQNREGKELTRARRYEKIIVILKMIRMLGEINVAITKTKEGRYCTLPAPSHLNLNAKENYSACILFNVHGGTVAWLSGYSLVIILDGY